MNCHKHPPDLSPELRRLFHHLVEHLDRGFSALQKELQTMNQEFTDLIAEVAALRTVEESAAAALDGLEAQVIALGDAPTKAQLTDLRTSVSQGKQLLADAIVRNTPAAPGT